jgi:hypothetical protein
LPAKTIGDLGPSQRQDEPRSGRRTAELHAAIKARASICALAFEERRGTDTRSELGGRFDRVLAIYSNAVLALRGRLAWAHDW